MKFLEKLIEDTKDGDLDFIWKFNEPDKYTFFAPKDPMNGLNFDLSKDNVIIFPNGFGLLCDKERLNVLKDEIRKAIQRGAISIMDQYVKYPISDVEDEENQASIADISDTTTSNETITKDATPPKTAKTDSLLDFALTEVLKRKTKRNN